MLSLALFTACSLFGDTATPEPEDKPQTPVQAPFEPPGLPPLKDAEAKLTMSQLETELPKYVGKVVNLTGQYYATSVGDERYRVIFTDEAGKARMNCYTKHPASFRGTEPKSTITAQGVVYDDERGIGLRDCLPVQE